MMPLFQDPYAYARYEIAGLNLDGMEDQELLDAVDALTFRQAKLLNQLLCNVFMTSNNPIDQVELTVQKFKSLIDEARLLILVEVEPTLQ